MNKIIKLLVLTVLMILTVILAGCGRGIDKYVAEGDVDRVKRILDKDPAALHTKTSNYSSLLHVAAQYGRDECVELLVNKGLEPDILQRYTRRRPIHKAIMNGHLSTVKLLVSLGASVKTVSRSDIPPVYLASRNGRLDILRFLVDRGADVGERSKNGFSSLHAAAIEGFLDIAEFLVERGVDVNVETEGKMRPLHNAARNDHIDIGIFLLGKGAAVDPKSNYGWTPLLLALRNRNIDSIRLFVDRGADVFAANNGGFTMLHLSAYYKDSGLIEYFLKKGVSPNVVNSRGNTALHYSVIRNHLDGVKSLLAFGVDTNIEDKFGYTPLEWARHSGKRKIIELMTSLHKAAAGGDLAGIKDLANRYPSLVNCRDENGWLPLHHAAKAGAVEVVKALIKAGGKRGEEALLESIPLLRGSVARLMIPYDIRDLSRPYNKTAAEIAEQFNHPDIAELLSRPLEPAAI